MRTKYWEFMVAAGGWYLIFMDHGWFLASLVAVLLLVCFEMVRRVMELERRVRFMDGMMEKVVHTVNINTDNLIQIAGKVYGPEIARQVGAVIAEDTQDD